MSRSRRKTPIIPVCSASSSQMKKWKKIYNKLMRRVSVEAEPPKKIEHSDVWNSPKDGKMWAGKHCDPRWMRK